MRDNFFQADSEEPVDEEFIVDHLLALIQNRAALTHIELLDKMAESLSELLDRVPEERRMNIKRTETFKQILDYEMGFGDVDAAEKNIAAIKHQLEHYKYLLNKPTSCGFQASMKW